MIGSQIYLRAAQAVYLPASSWSPEIHQIFLRDPEYYDEVPAKLVLTTNGQATNSFEDNLGPLVQNLCLSGAQHIFSGQTYRFRLWAYASEGQITLREGQAQITGTHCGTADYPTRELAFALLHCAKAAITLLQTAQANLPGSRASIIETLERLYQATEAASG